MNRIKESQAKSNREFLVPVAHDARLYSTVSEKEIKKIYKLTLL